MWTLDDLAQLKQALVSGASNVSISSGGITRQVTWRSKSELLELIRMVEDELSGATAEDMSSVVIGGFSRKGKSE